MKKCDKCGRKQENYTYKEHIDIIYDWDICYNCIKKLMEMEENTK